MISYYILTLIAIAFNFRDNRMLALTILVSASIFVPVPAEHFYLTCSLCDALIGLLALCIGGIAARPVWRISVLLVAFHFLGYLLNGYAQSSPYHTIVRICEHAELLACILLSSPIIKRLKNA